MEVSQSRKKGNTETLYATLAILKLGNVKVLFNSR